MDIVFATNNEFCPYAAIAITSLLEHNRGKIRIHLFTIDVDESNLQQISQLVSSYIDAKLQIYPVNASLLDGFPNPDIYSWAAYLRLFMPEQLPAHVDKVLYLDADLIINGSLQELWNIDISDYSCAAVYDTILSYSIVKDYIGYDYYAEGYANSGVLLINLAYWRAHHIQQQLMDFLKTHLVKLPDQDAINAVLHGTIKFIHPKWNCHTGYFAFPPLVRGDQKKYIKTLWRNARIVHFTGPAKPWYRECVNPYKKDFRKYAQLVSWNGISDRELQPNRRKRLSIIALRHCKNVVAMFFSLFYK